MSDFSVKGVLRHHLGLTGDISLKSVLFPLPLPIMSLRGALEGVARTEREYQRHDPYDSGLFSVLRWKARYTQTWTHIRVRVELKPDNQQAEDALDDELRELWQHGIEETWSNHYWARASGELACRFMFEVVWVEEDAHHVVHVKFGAPQGNAKTNMNNWYTLNKGGLAAHEYGHMIGKYDEYEHEDAPGREEVETGTVMDNNSCHVSPRQFTRFAQDLGCFVCDENGTMIPKPY